MRARAPAEALQDKANRQARLSSAEKRYSRIRAEEAEYQLLLENKKKRYKVRARQLLIEVLEAYGGAVCSCCGETEPLFLSIDHINEDGAEMRKIHGSGIDFYRWLKKHDYPGGFQVLCMNCNLGKAINGGQCPHVTG